MVPELPKVQPEMASKEALEGVKEAYEQEKDKSAAGPEKPLDLARAGSVGLEAGLTNFEGAAQDGTVGSGSASDDDDDDNQTQSDESSASTLVGVQKRPALNVVGKTPQTAEDNDDIEKEWVDKAKKIVSQTKSDPYLQERSVSRLQADYLKKRFNKDVKLPKEDQ